MKPPLGPGAKAAPPAKDLVLDLGKGVKIEFVLIPAGEFLMGSPDSDPQAENNEKPQHRVRITKPFYMGKYKVMQDQWEAMWATISSAFRGPKYPVNAVSWDDCQAFIKKLNDKFRVAGRKVPPADRGPVGVCLPGGQLHAMVLRRRRFQVGRICLVRRQCRGFHPSVGHEEAERLGPVRHPRRPLGVVRRYLRQSLLFRIAQGRPHGASFHPRLLRVARRLVVSRARVCAIRPAELARANVGSFLHGFRLAMSL